eukprot:TRINITY_DN2242_c0_g1_i1.p1 TRINITY_DN2242_c0_g1~~TRINITY_DN2242_c0_g1_i1.p1  ORF type:complete len:336 (+),score=99.90 TRINITY_DN2242_c0_g1_i1:60-1010(+)
MAAAEAKLKSMKEADKLLKSANENTKTTLFRWRPNWGDAANEYEAAAKKYQTLGPEALAKCIEAYKGAAWACENLSTLNHAAKHSEMAASLEAKAGNTEDAIKTYREAARYYLENSQIAKCAETLLKAAQLAQDNVELATQCYLDACEVYEKDDEKALQADNTFKTTIAYLIRTEQHRDALMIFGRLNKLYLLNFETKANFVYKNYLSMIVLCCYLHDVEIGFNNFQSFSETPGWMESEYSSLANGLLLAFDEGNEDALRATLSNRTFDLLDAPIARLARRLELSEEDKKRAADNAVAADVVGGDDEPAHDELGIL